MYKIFPKSVGGTATCCACCLCFVALIPLLGQAGVFTLTESLPKTNKANAWSEKPWTTQQCTVLGSGVAYRGTCKDTWISDAPTGEECPASDPSWTSAEMNAASRCEARASEDWANIRRRLVGDRGLRQSEPVTTFSDVGLAVSLPVADPGRRLRCVHSFLPWVRVSLNGTKRCAFRWGMPMAEGSNKHFATGVAVGGNITCYTPVADDCSVALEYPMNGLTDNWPWIYAGHDLRLLAWVGLGFLGLGCLCCLIVFFSDMSKDDADEEMNPEMMTMMHNYE